MSSLPRTRKPRSKPSQPPVANIAPTPAAKPRELTPEQIEFVGIVQMLMRDRRALQIELDLALADLKVARAELSLARDYCAGLELAIIRGDGPIDCPINH